MCPTFFVEPIVRHVSHFSFIIIESITPLREDGVKNLSESWQTKTGLCCVQIFEFYNVFKS